MRNQTYLKINQALEREFGKGQVRLKKSDNPKYEYLLWFKPDEPGREMIDKAQFIVNSIQPICWLNDESYHVDE